MKNTFLATYLRFDHALEINVFYGSLVGIMYIPLILNLIWYIRNVNTYIYQTSQLNTKVQLTVLHIV
jgi:hypothetical protein